MSSVFEIHYLYLNTLCISYSSCFCNQIYNKNYSGGLNKNSFLGSYSWMFASQLVNILGRIRRYSLVGGVSLAVIMTFQRHIPGLTLIFLLCACGSNALPISFLPCFLLWWKWTNSMQICASPQLNISFYKLPESLYSKRMTTKRLT